MIRMTDTTPPASAQELIKQYCAAVGRTDWAGMLAAKEQLAARAEYAVAMEVRLAQQNLARATTRLTAVQSERSVARQALEDARERAPLAIEQAPPVSNDSRVMTRATIEAHWRDALPQLEEVVTAAETRYQDTTQAVSDAQERLDQLLAAAYARVQPVADDAADRRGQS
jgi:hypothetical protein